MIQLTRTDIALIVGAIGKIFIEIADAMPQPSPNANYFVKWFYGFMQRLASNGMKAERAESQSNPSQPTLIVPKS